MGCQNVPYSSISRKCRLFSHPPTVCCEHHVYVTNDKVSERCIYSHNLCSVCSQFQSEFHLLALELTRKELGYVSPAPSTRFHYFPSLSLSPLIVFWLKVQCTGISSTLWFARAWQLSFSSMENRMNYGSPPERDAPTLMRYSNTLM